MALVGMSSRHRSFRKTNINSIVGKYRVPYSLPSGTLALAFPYALRLLLDPSFQPPVLPPVQAFLVHVHALSPLAPPPAQTLALLLSALSPPYLSPSPSVLPLSTGGSNADPGLNNKERETALTWVGAVILG